MSTEFSRRDFVGLIPAASLGATALFGPSTPSVRAADAPPPDAGPYLGFPRQDQKLVQEIVGASHAQEAKVRELIELKPQLVNAWWDWGFGDWESPLGAASHVGQRGIAEFLLSKGARVDIFAAAMLGVTDVVKAFVAARPGVQRTYGPHGITLLAHAKAGGDKAKDTLAYLESLGDAGTALPSSPLSDEQASGYVGTYRFGPGEADIFEVKFEKSQLTILRPGGSPRRMVCFKEHEFFPAGAPDVKIRFSMKDGKPTDLAVVEKEPVISAKRT
jgi:hypothetical protein